MAKGTLHDHPAPLSQECFESGRALPREIVAAPAICWCSFHRPKQLRENVAAQSVIACRNLGDSLVAGPTLSATVDGHTEGDILDAGRRCVVTYKVGRTLFIKVVAPADPGCVVSLGHDLGGNGVVPSIGQSR